MFCPKCGAILKDSVYETEVDLSTVKNIDESTAGTISENQTPEAFKGDKYRFIVVADKYQTGFSEKLLSVMYIDKPLHNIKTVQTLSRLNRTMSNNAKLAERDCFILDFVNDREEIKEAFQTYYGKIELAGEYTIEELKQLKEIIEKYSIIEKTEIEENNKKIQEITDNVTKLTTAYQEYSTAQQELTTKINDIKKRQYENNFNIKTIDEKLQLFSQAKCPTCGVSFVSESYTELKQKLADLKNAKNAITAELNNELNEVNTQYSNVNSYLTKINNTIYQYKSEISTLANKNKMLEEQFKSSAEFSSIQNIVNSTAEQMDAIKQQLSDNSLKLKDLQNLALVYSIDGVKQKVIINYLPILN